MKSTSPIPCVVAIDGPAASGKSSVGLAVANQLGYLFLDTGIMYRAVTWKAIQEGADIEDEDCIGEIAERIKIEFHPATKDDGRVNDVVIDGIDATWKVRSPDVNGNVSQVSRYAGVRNALTDQQRKIGNKGKVVMAGRDIGTVVLPDAQTKIYLEASAEERAKRRFQEDISRGKAVKYNDILNNIRMRDAIDSGRDIAPLKPAHNAHIINTDGKMIQEVVQEIMNLIEMEY